MTLPTHQLDVLGFFCPVPLAKTRQALEKLPPGRVLEVIADDPEVMHDLPMFIGRSQHNLISMNEKSGEIRIVIEVK